MPSEGPGTEFWPIEIRLKSAEKALEIDFDNGDRFSFPAELLRVESPSAEVQGHGPSQKQIVGGKRDVGISRVEPVGNYAVRLVFDDGHSTGLFSWQYLHELGRDQEKIWTEYLAALDEQGLTRGS